MTEARAARERETIVIVSIDTEEDNWLPSRNGVTVDNIGHLRRLARFLDQLGVRPTYFTAYQVAIRPGAVDVLRECCVGGRGEIGAHLHPWNTPPLSEALVPRNSMLKNLPAELQLAKLHQLTAALEHAFGAPPRTFRAGRYGVGPDTIAALVRCGYQVDSSVSPYQNLKGMDDGPNFVGAPLEAYHLAPDCDVRRPAPNGMLLEIPLSCGFSRGPFRFWDPVRRLLEARPWRWLHLAGIAGRAGMVERLVLCPELASVTEMLTLSRQLLAHGVRHLQLTWHSPTLIGGLSPFAPTAADVERLYASIAEYLDGLAGMTAVRFATMSEAAALLW